MKKGYIHGGRIYTLAQSGTTYHDLPPVIVAGNGSKPSNRDELKRKAKKKIITQKMMLRLIDIAKRKKDNLLENTFWNTYYCQNNIISHQKRIYGKYCKNRFCTICLGNRKAELINKYLPVLSTWEEPYFVTLTVRSCSANKLPKMMNGMVRAFRKIKERNKKRYQRGKGIRLVGIRSLECNFNPVKRTYNPHFHIIVSNKEIAHQLKNDWLNIWTRKHSESWCQDMQKVRTLEGSLMEIIKYGTKIFTEPDVNNKTKKKIPAKIYVAALYNILSSMRNHRIFDRFGFNLPKAGQKKESKTTQVFDYDSWIYDSTHADWFSELTGDVFADFQVDIKLQNLLNNNIDTQLH